MLVMGSRLSQIKPNHPASILAYPGRSASATLIRGLQSEPAFRKAGYRIQLVEDSAGLDNALKAGKYDVVVADVANANEMSAQVSSAASKPILLPVAFKASKEQQSAAQKKIPLPPESPSKHRELPGSHRPCDGAKAQRSEPVKQRPLDH